ncbi:hypothetical protein FACS189421_14390 [Bacteroidia bacterium]|nr:hypothetical protein FACS189421_14390 [Bacteroidia bacterium]
MFGVKTFGHLGTLDPIASGLLLIALGEATKMIPYLEGIGHKAQGIKEYLFSIQWGIETDTGDITGKSIEHRVQSTDSEPNLCPSSDALEMAMAALTGEIDQVPPAYSAVHVNGVRAYQLARAGRAVELPPRLVTVYELKEEGKRNKEKDKITTALSDVFAGTAENLFLLPSSLFFLRCSPGTYVRSIVRDIAKLCGTIATTGSIRRTKTHGFDIKDAVTLDLLEKLFNNDPALFRTHLRPLDFGLDDIPVADIGGDAAILFQHGGFVERYSGLGIRDSGIVRVYSDEKFIGIGQIEDKLLKPKRIIKQ